MLNTVSFCTYIYIFHIVMPPQDVNVGSVRTSSLAKEIGCSVVSGGKGDDIAAKIVLPLKFPEHRKGKSSGR
jgi:hypothetical protein